MAIVRSPSAPRETFFCHVLVSCSSSLSMKSWARPLQTQEPGELAPVLTVKSDSWAAAFTLLEASTRTRFFDGRSKVAIAEKIRSFVRELNLGLAGGPYLTKLQGAIKTLSPSTQKHVAELIHHDPRRRASCGKFKVCNWYEKARVSDQPGALWS